MAAEIGAAFRIIITDERIAEIKVFGCNIGETGAWKMFDEPGAHLTLRQIRPCRVI